MKQGPASIFAIELPNKVWRPKVPNKYVPLDYSDNIDDGIFDYTVYGKTVLRPKDKWNHRDHVDIIEYEHKRDNEELIEGLKIGKSVNE